MLAQASEVQMVKWLKARLGWAEETHQAWFRCGYCGEKFTADAMSSAPIHGEDSDGVACVGVGSRTRTPGHRA
jgi:hypothetical protein